MFSEKGLRPFLNISREYDEYYLFDLLPVIAIDLTLVIASVILISSLRARRARQSYCCPQIASSSAGSSQ